MAQLGKRKKKEKKRRGKRHGRCRDLKACLPRSWPRRSLYTGALARHVARIYFQQASSTRPLRHRAASQYVGIRAGDRAEAGAPRTTHLYRSAYTYYKSVPVALILRDDASWISLSGSRATMEDKRRTDVGTRDRTSIYDGREISRSR